MTDDLYYRKMESTSITDLVDMVRERDERIAELEKENEMLAQGYVWHDYDAGEDCYEDSHEGRWVERDEIVKLKRTKELLAKWVELFKSKTDDVPPTPIQIDTEQFLKELDK